MSWTAAIVALAVGLLMVYSYFYLQARRRWRQRLDDDRDMAASQVAYWTGIEADLERQIRDVAREQRDTYAKVRGGDEDAEPEYAAVLRASQDLERDINQARLHLWAARERLDRLR